MDLRLLEFFLRVSEFGSINKAATDLQLSQPALSRHVAELERELGVKLFTRTRTGVSLTEAGNLLADRARPLLLQFAEMKEQVGERAAGNLAMGMPTSWHRVLTSTFVSRMLDEHKSVNLRVHESVSHVLKGYLLAGLLDLAIAPFVSAAATGYSQVPLVHEPLVLVGGRSAALRPEKPALLSQLDGLRLVLPARPNFVRFAVEHALNRKGLSLNVVVEADTLTLCLDASREGYAYTVVPSCTLYGKIPQDDLSWTPIKGLFVTWALCENIARSHSQAVRQAKRLTLSILDNRLKENLWLGAQRLGPLR